MDEKLNQDTEMMNLNEFMEVHTLDGQTSDTFKVTYFNLCDITRQMASELDAIKDSVIFKTYWRKQVEDLSREQSDTGDSESLSGNEEIYTMDLIHSKIFKSCYSQYKALYEGLRSGELSLEEIDEILVDMEGKFEDLEKELRIMCRTNSSDNSRWIRSRVHQIKQYHDLHLAIDSAKIIMDIRNTVCPEGDFQSLEKLLQMVCLKNILLVRADLFFAFIIYISSNRHTDALYLLSANIYIYFNPGYSSVLFFG